MNRQIKIAVLTADVATVRGALAGLGGTAIVDSIVELVPCDASAEDKSDLQNRLEDICAKTWPRNLIVCPRHPDMTIQQDRYDHVLVIGEMQIGFENQIRIPYRCGDNYREPNWTGEVAGILRYLLTTQAKPE